MPSIAEVTPAQKAEAIGALYAPATSAIADCVRAFVTAPKGRDLIAVDFSAIEARGVQWLAGNDKVLDAFRAGDSDPTKPDAYMDAASGLFGEPVTSKKDPRRAIGKVNVLSLGFQGGVAAQQKMAQTYGVDMGLAYEPLMAVATPGQIAAAEKACTQKLRQFPKMTREFFIASDIAKQRWRANNAPVVEYWRDLGQAAIDAVLQPGSVQAVGPAAREIRFKKNGSFLWMRLPSGRAMCYPYPAIQKRAVPWGEERLTPCETEDLAVERFGKNLLGWENGVATVLQPEYKNALTYMADKKDLGGWVRVSTYGGSLCENVDQAVCRDLLWEAMPRLEAAGYEIVFHNYDEVMTEQDEAFGSVEEIERLMCITAPWAAGFPVAAEGWRAHRYRKA